MMFIYGQTASFSMAIGWPPISKKPSLVFPLIFPAPKERCDFDSRTSTSFRLSCVLADNQAESPSNSSRSSFLEKEFRFVPSFNDYVKVMESVKVDRVRDLGEVNGKSKFIGAKKKNLLRDAHFGNEHNNDNKRSVGRESSVRRGSTRPVKGLEEGIMDDETVGRDRTSRRVESGKNVRYGSQKNKKDFFSNKNVSFTGEDSTSFSDGRVVHRDNKKILQPKQLKTTRDGETGIFNGNKNKGDAEKNYRKVNDVKDGGIGSESPVRTFQVTSKVTERKIVNSNNAPTREHTKRLVVESREFERSGLGEQFYRRRVEKKRVEYENRSISGGEVSGASQRNRFDGRHTTRSRDYSSIDTSTGDYGSKINRSNKNLGTVSLKENTTKTGSIKDDKPSDGTAEGYDLEDRAAFRTFEVFTDVRNRPRVLRMELEEKIKNLAKQLHAADINMPEWQFSKMIHDTKIKFTDHSILRVVQILGTFGNWKRVLQVVEWLQKKERFQSFKSRYMYTTALDVLGKAKRPVEALNIFYAMREELSSYPDLATYHSIAVTLGQAGFMKELFDVIDCMRTTPEKKFKLGPLQKWDPRLEPDLVVYNAVLNACVQRKNWEGAFWVLQQLKEKGIKPSNTTYGLVMEVMLACGKYNLVHEFFRKLEKSSIPGALNYKVLVNALWREGRTDEAVLVVEDMERRGVVGSASLYYDLARCLCSAGRCQEALLQINKICKVAKKPLVVTYTGLIQACLDSGSIENAAFIFNEMQKYCVPNFITCNIMLKSYIEHGRFKEAKDLFQKILDDGHVTNNQDDMRQRVRPDKFTFNTIIEACAKFQEWDDFENAYRQMLKHGHHFDTKRHLRIVLDAFRAGKVRVLELTWKHLARYGRVPPTPIIKERFCLKLMNDDHIAAISSINIHDSAEIHHFSERSWLDLLYSNSSRFKSATISKLADELKCQLAEKNEPNPACQNLAHACSQFLANKNNESDLPNEITL